MDYVTFVESLKAETPPATSVYLQALWYDKKNFWKKAHELVDDLNDKKACLVHAYLHRKEGDIYNADYWYARSATKRSSKTLDDEWYQLVMDLLEKE